MNDHLDDLGPFPLEGLHELWPALAAGVIPRLRAVLLLPPRAGEIVTALCANEDPELWFPDSTKAGFMGKIKLAQAICSRCPMRIACAQIAVDEDHRYGIWGGLGQTERARITKRRP